MSTRIASVVIPAHDEAAVIDRCLAELTTPGGTVPDDLEVVVVANGCTDDTATRARARGVRVVETGVPGKAHALNLGDEACTAFPRAYLDADVSVSAAGLRAVVAELGRSGALAAAPRLHVDTTRSSWAVRAYYRVWTALPYVTDAMVGSGLYVLSAAGRARFDRFPDAIGDDTFVRGLFGAGERVSVATATFTVHPPRTLAALVRIKTRAAAGNAEHRAGRADAGEPAVAPGNGHGLLPVLLAHPRLWPDVPVYGAVAVATRLLARRRARLARHGAVAWERDTTSRTPQDVTTAP